MRLNTLVRDLSRHFFKNADTAQPPMWIWTVALWLFFVGLLGAGVWTLYQKSTQPIWISPDNLSAAQINVVTDTLAPFGEMSFFSNQLGDIAQAVQALSWVESVTVDRDWQRGLVVMVTPRQAVAHFGSGRFLDANGVIFDAVEKTNFINSDLIFIDGDPTSAQYVMSKVQRINRWFDFANMQVQGIVLTPRQTWIVRFDSGLRITVDFKDVDQKLFNFSQIAKNGQLPMPLMQIGSVDLRYNNGFAVLPKSKTDA